LLDSELLNNLESKVFVPLTTFALAAVAHLHRLAKDAIESILPTFMSISQNFKVRPKILMLTG
jgi:hypothetical protein